MRNLLFLTLFLTSLISNEQSYFEGELQYAIDYEMINKNISKEIVVREMGDSFKAYVKEDKYIMIYNTSGELGWTKTTVRLDEGFSYIEFEKSDTIYKHSIKKNENRLTEFALNKSESRNVLGELCESVTLNYESINSNDQFSHVEGKHFFNPKYRLNPEKYKNYNSGFWNLYVKEAKAISIRNEHTYKDLFKSVSEAIKITEKKIPEKMFKLDPNKILKEEEK